MGFFQDTGCWFEVVGFTGRGKKVVRTGVLLRSLVALAEENERVVYKCYFLQMVKHANKNELLLTRCFALISVHGCLHDLNF